MGECLSRTIEIYRRDALQSDGKSDGENVASSRREKFTVKRIPKLTANSGRKVQHPCGFPVDRRIGPADGRSACCQAIGRTVRSVSWRRAAQGNGRAGDETTCLSLIYRTTSSTAASPRPSIHPWQPATADLGDLSFPSRTEPAATGYRMPAMRWTAAAWASAVAGSTRPGAVN
jgi:hypothetical protein